MVGHGAGLTRDDTHVELPVDPLHRLVIILGLLLELAGRPSVARELGWINLGGGDDILVWALAVDRLAR